MDSTSPVRTAAPIPAVPQDGTPSRIDVPSPVPGECWRTLRSWLEGQAVEFEPSLHPEHGLTGYGLRLRNYLVGVGLGMRATGPALTLTAVLCRGMDREQHALVATDRANAALGLGQILYLPGPPAELSFFATVSFDLLDEATFGGLFDAMVAELNDVGFAAVQAVRGYHPTDHAAPWGDPLLAPHDDDPEETLVASAPADDPPPAEASGDRAGEEVAEPPVPAADEAAKAGQGPDCPAESSGRTDAAPARRRRRSPGS